MSVLEKLANNYFVKALVVTIVVIVGVAGGVYIGYAFIDQKTIPIAEDGARPEPTESMNFTFGVGDLFPLEDFTTLLGETANFEQLLMGKPTLLVFASTGCEPCEKFFNFFSTVEPQLNDDVQTIVCLADRNPDIPESYSSFLENKTAVFVDTDYFLSYYNVNVYPTLVGIDEHGFVTHIQYVPTDWLDREIAEQYTRINLGSK